MKKKIVFVTLSLEGGGAEKILSRLVLGLHSEFDIVLITFYKKGRYLEELLSIPGLEYYCLNAEKGNTISFAIRLRRIIRQVAPFKVLSFLYYPNIITYLSLAEQNTKFILSERSNHRLYLTSSFKHKVWRWLLKRAYKKSESIITVSEGSKEAIVSDFKVSESKVGAIQNGISFSNLDKLKKEPLTELNFNEDEKSIIAVGSFNKAKNYPLLIESFRILHSKYKNTRLIILGKGEKEDEIKELISRLNLQDVVNLTGYCANPYKYLEHASCYVLSSSWEGFPNSLIEAMYINGHVISTNCPTGPAEIITDNEDGILCELDNPVEMAAAMEKMCFDEDFRERVFENSRKKVATFDEEIMIDKYRQILNKIV